ncbi:MAG TPA: universal stress protein [Polyangiaceae bacterium]
MNQTKYVVVVGVDYTPASDLAFEEALAITSRRVDAHLHVVHVRSRSRSSSPDVEAQTSSEDKRDLQTYVAQRVSAFRACHARTPFERLFYHLRRDEAWRQIAQLAADVEADLIVVGTHDRNGLPRFLLGSVAEVVTRLAPCAVLVARPKAVSAPAPSIEPPCPRCIEVRAATNCAELWCEQHGERHGAAHSFTEPDLDPSLRPGQSGAAQQ